MNVEQDSSSISRKWPQRLAACLAAVAMVCGGTLEGWTSPALPYLQSSEDSTNITIHNIANGSLIDNASVYHVDIKSDGITAEEASWVGSLGALGALFGAVPAGFMADFFGRRLLLLIIAVPYLLGWIIIIAAGKNAILLYVARFILGMATGASSVAVPIYNEEIAETSIRGEIGAYLDIAIAVGILYVYAIGAFVPYLWLCITSAVIPIVYALTFFWMPESPLYLLAKGRTTEAEKSLRWLRNVKKLEDSIIQTELQEMEATIKKTNKNCEEINESKWKELKNNISSISFSSPTFKTVALVLGLMIFQQLSGINAVIFYTVDIFQAAGSTLSPYYCTLIIGVVQVISVYISAVLMDRLGRRILLLASDVGMAVSLLALAIFFYFKEDGTDLSFLNWLPIVALNVYIISFCIGYGPIPWFMMVELATNDTKGWVSSLGVSVNWIMVFLMTKVFTLMLTSLGQAVTYGILCAINILGTVFVAVWIPETKGKTREEIQAMLARK